MEYRTKNPIPVIFLGDKLQIPPVKEVITTVFTKATIGKYGILVLTLNEIVRQKAGNPIIDYATYIRSNYTSSIGFKDVSMYTPTIRVFNPEESKFIDLVDKYYCSDAYKADSDFIRTIAWTNNKVDELNSVIRSRVFKDSEHIVRIMNGEKLIVDKPLIRKIKGKDNIIFNTSDELTVLSYTIDVVNVDYAIFEKGEAIPKLSEFRVYNCLVDSDVKPYSVNVQILHESSIASFNSLVEHLKQVALKTSLEFKKKAWVEYFKVMNFFADVKYSYAITAHKSQGSTYGTVIIHETDVNKNKDISELNRIMYVAVTRAKNEVILLR
jgi:exodeoxyribonuclease-5